MIHPVFALDEMPGEYTYLDIHANLKEAAAQAGLETVDLREAYQGRSRDGDRPRERYLASQHAGTPIVGRVSLPLPDRRQLGAVTKFALVGTALAQEIGSQVTVSFISGTVGTE